MFESSVGSTMVKEEMLGARCHLDVNSLYIIPWDGTALPLLC